MRGRLQASCVAALGYFLPLLTPIVIALVTLRRGASEGTLMLLISLIPAVVWLVLGEATPPFIWITLAALVVVYVPALVLRTSVSWPLTIISLVVSCILVGLLLAEMVGDRADEVSAMLLGQSQQKDIEQQFADLLKDYVAVVGLSAYLLAINAVLGLFIGRWMQAALYNPGGFGAEFRVFRLNAVLAGICFFASVFCFTQSEQLVGWFHVFALPLILVALSVAHSVVKEKQLAVHWLVLAYIATLMASPLMVLIGFLDTWLNFRDRLTQK